MGHVMFVAVAGLGFGQGSVSDVPVPKFSAAVVSIPHNPDTTADVLQRLLTTAGVRFALEGAPLRRSTPIPGEVWRQPDSVIRLGGLTLREALDRVISLDPRYEWREADGRIVVHAVTAGGDDWLQRRIPSFRLINATLDDALTLLMKEIDPTRRGGSLAASLSMSVGVESAAARGRTASEKGITVRVDDATLVDVLDAIATAAGASWSVRYNGPTATAEHAMVAMAAPSRTIVSAPASTRTPRTDPAASPTQVVIGPSLATTLGMYAHKARIRFGLESLPEAAKAPVLHPIYAPIEVPAAAPAEAIARIVALEPRYGWSDAGGIFNVRPRADLAARTPLDQDVDEFVANGEIAEAILDRIAHLLGEVSGRGEGWGSIEGSEEHRKQLAASRRPLSFTVRNTSIRELLNTLCRTEGTLSWSVTPHTDPKGISVNLQLNSWDGWGPSRTARRQTW